MSTAIEARRPAPIKEFSCQRCLHAMTRDEAWVSPRTPGGDVAYLCEAHAVPGSRPVAQR